MARRKDGSARRYEFQIFDNPQGRAIAQTLEHVQSSGGSVADFIREALLFYIEHQQRAPDSPAPKLQHEINALWKALANQSRAGDARQILSASSLSASPHEDEAVELQIKAVKNGSSGKNFLSSLMSLQ